jgi:hypothetical protein
MFEAEASACARAESGYCWTDDQCEQLLRVSLECRGVTHAKNHWLAGMLKGCLAGIEGSARYVRTLLRFRNERAVYLAFGSVTKSICARPPDCAAAITW